MTYRGRPIMGAISGLILGLFIDADLLFAGTIRLEQRAVWIPPAAGLVLGIALALIAPFGRAQARKAGRRGPKPL